MTFCRRLIVSTLQRVTLRPPRRRRGLRRRQMQLGKSECVVSAARLVIKHSIGFILLIFIALAMAMLIDWMLTCGHGTQSRAVCGSPVETRSTPPNGTTERRNDTIKNHTNDTFLIGKCAFHRRNGTLCWLRGATEERRRQSQRTEHAN